MESSFGVANRFLGVLISLFFSGGISWLKILSGLDFELGEDLWYGSEGRYVILIGPFR